MSTTRCRPAGALPSVTRSLAGAVLALTLPLCALAAPPALDRAGGDLRSGPQGGAWLLEMDPQVARGETARQVSLDLLVGAETLLRRFDLGDPAREQGLLENLAETRELFRDAPPAELQAVADRMGPELAELHQAMKLQLLTLIELSRTPAGDRGRSAATKSAGFPTLDPNLPYYPEVSIGSVLVEVFVEPFSSGSIEAIADAAIDILESADIPLCSVAEGSDGRAERLSNELVFLGVVTNQIANIVNGVLQDVCGGAAIDVTVVSAGYSCQLCCVYTNLYNGIANLLHETTMLCQDMVDGAEIEASWQAARTTYDAVAHVHGDVEAVQGTADEILDIVTCKPVAALLRQHGCDGIDSDCDGLIDECDEDAFGPDLHVDEAVAQPWYGSMAEAREAVRRAVFASDDCQAVTVDLAPLTGACGSVEAVVTATDACGNATVKRAIVRVDAAAPSVSIPSSLASSCHPDLAAAEAAVLAAAAISDDCTPAGELSVAVESTVTECALRVRVTATDRAGRVASDAVTVSVDTRSPSLEIGRLELATLGPACFESVAAAEAAVAEVVRASDNCSDGPALAPVISSSGDPCRLRVAAAVTDDCGRTSSDEVEVRVDDAPPVVSASAAITELSPANHELVDVGFDFSALDDCAGEIAVRVSVTSDEPTSTASGAGGENGPDAVVLRGPDGRPEAVLLRAERSSSGNGRVYRISVEAIDACGHAATASVDVSVPPNGNAPAVDDGQWYDATGTN